MPGMPWGMQELLNRKYQIMEEQARTGQYNAETNRTGVLADANLTGVKAGLLPKQTAADIARQQAEEARIREETKYVGDLAKSSIGLNAANAYNARAQGGLYGSQTETQGQLNKMLPRSYGGFGWNPEYETAIRGFFDNSLRGLPDSIRRLGFGN